MERVQDVYRPAELRRQDFEEVERPLTAEEISQQAGRCMNCGVPFCHGAGCPLDQLIPDVNAAVARDDWREAWELLSATGGFPEFTGRVCPALCEGACSDGIDSGEPVMIRQLEKEVVERAFANDWVRPRIPDFRSGRRVAVVGSGPAGLAAANELNQRGHVVTVYEADAAPGGLLRYGIPDFKLAKRVIDRRLGILAVEGIEFVCNTRIGRDISTNYLLRRHDAVVVAVGAPEPRDLMVPGRELGGIYFALDFLKGQNRVLSGELPGLPISAVGKRVLVIGGGDTGSDCVGTAIRQGAAEVSQIELLPKPPKGRAPSTPWPEWPYMLRTSSSHREGGTREWELGTKSFTGKDGRVTGAEVTELVWEQDAAGNPVNFRVRGVRKISADLVLLAVGFTGVGGGLAEAFGLRLERGRMVDDPARGVYAVGDAATGASLVVKAMADAREKIKKIF